MVYCSAFNCNNDGKKVKNCSFFQFPSDEKYRQIWKEKVRRLNWEPNKYSRLCSAHFEPHCFVHDPKIFESLGLTKPRKVILKRDAIPTIFDYEDRTAKQMNDSRKRKHEESNGSEHANKGRKILEVIDFSSLLDDFLKGLQSEEELKSSDVKKESDELVKEIVPQSSPCEGGDKFVLLLSKPLPEDIDDIKSSLLCVRFGDGHVVPVKIWKENVIKGEHIPRSDKPGAVSVQLETNDGKVLGRTVFLYKDEICSGFQKIVCSTNYGGKLVQAFFDKTTMQNQAVSGQHSTHSESSPALSSILKLMLYIAAKNEAVEFVEKLYGTKTGKPVVQSFASKEQFREETISQSTMEQGLASYLEDISTRLTAEEKKRLANDVLKVAEIEDKKKPQVAKKTGTKNNTEAKRVKPQSSKKGGNANQSLTKKPDYGITVLSRCCDLPARSNSLLLLSDIALGHLNSDSVEYGCSEDLSRQKTSSSVKEKKRRSSHSRNDFKFTRKVHLLPNGCTRLPRQGEMSKFKSTSAANRGIVELENDMPAAEVLQRVRTVLSTLEKKRRIRLAAADAKGKLDYFKGTKWTAKTVRQRIKFNSVLYVTA